MLFSKFFIFSRKNNTFLQFKIVTNYTIKHDFIYFFFDRTWYFKSRISERLSWSTRSVYNEDGSAALLLTPASRMNFVCSLKAMLQNKMCSDMLLSLPACSRLSRLPELIMPAGQKRSVPVHARFYQIQPIFLPLSLHTSYVSTGIWSYIFIFVSPL